MAWPLPTIDTRDPSSDRILRHAQHLVDGRDALGHFVKAILAQRDHSTFDAYSSEFSNIEITGDLVAQRVIQNQ